MRALFSVLALLLLVGAAPRDWAATTTRLPSGTYLIGNPAAPVKLVEYASYTCPHCAAFAAESAPVLHDRFVRDGSVSLEYRHLIRDGLDLGAAILARCTGTARFAATTGYIYGTQPSWLQRGFEWQQANAQRIGMYPRLAQVRALADGAGLTAAVQARGLTPAATDACFADAAEVDRILKITAAAPPSVASTPSFLINGKATPPVAWAGLEPLLRAAGAK